MSFMLLKKNLFVLEKAWLFTLLPKHNRAFGLDRWFLPCMLYTSVDPSYISRVFHAFNPYLTAMFFPYFSKSFPPTSTNSFVTVFLSWFDVSIGCFGIQILIQIRSKL